MKKYFALLFISAASLQADLQFAGFFTTAKESFYSLTEVESNVSSGWLKRGQSFRGYTIMSFDEEHDVITLKKSDQTLELRLKDSKVKSGKMTITGSIVVGVNEQIESVRASLFLGEEAVFPIKDGVTLHLTPEMRLDGNIRYRSRFVTKVENGNEEVTTAPDVVTRVGQSFGIRAGSFGYTFKP